MRAIRTEKAEVTYLGPSPEIADLPVERIEPGRIRATFALTDEERVMIAYGAQVQITIFQEPMPPISMSIGNEPEAAGAAGEKDYRCNVCDAMYVEARAILIDYECGHCGGELVLPEITPPAAPEHHPV